MLWEEARKILWPSFDFLTDESLGKLIDLIWYTSIFVVGIELQAEEFKKDRESQKEERPN